MGNGMPHRRLFYVRRHDAHLAKFQRDFRQRSYARAVYAIVVGD